MRQNELKLVHTYLDFHNTLHFSPFRIINYFNFELKSHKQAIFRNEVDNNRKLNQKTLDQKKELTSVV